MKKKCVALTALLLLSGCQQKFYSLIDVSWEQNGKSCIYKEQYGEVRQEWNSKTNKDEEKRYVSVVKSLNYGGVSCEKIIEAELKNKTNKSAWSNHFYQNGNVNTMDVMMQMQRF